MEDEISSASVLLAHPGPALSHDRDLQPGFSSQECHLLCHHDRNAPGDRGMSSARAPARPSPRARKT
jgi:hypothetical protein